MSRALIPQLAALLASGAFMTFLSQDALRRPERLGDVGELFAGDDELLEGVDPDAG